MTNMQSSAPSPAAPAEPPKKSNTPVIIGVIAFLALCVCCALAVGVYYLYTNGDQLFGTGVRLMQAFA